MNHSAPSAHQRRLVVVVTGATLLATSIAGFLMFSSKGDQSITLLLAYAGGIAMLPTP